MYTQTENAQNHDPRTKPPYLYCQLSANGYYRKWSFLFKDTNSHDLFSFQSNSVFTPLLNGLYFYYLFRLSIEDRQIGRVESSSCKKVRGAILCLNYDHNFHVFEQEKLMILQRTLNKKPFL